MRYVVATLSLLLAHAMPAAGQTWFDISSITAPDDEALAGRFGAVLALDGETLVVADPERSGESRDYGAASVYQRVGSAWEHQVTWSPEGLGFAPEFGTAVAIDGDTVAIGSPDADFTISEGLFGDGQVFVYEREGDAWTGPDIVFTNDQSRGDYGAAVALSGNHLAVGAPERNAGGGEVIVYERNGKQWEEVAILQDIEQRNFSDEFGQALLFVDDNTLLVGIRGKNNRVGAVAIFALQNGTWAHQTTLKPDATNNRTFFGSSLAYSEGTLVIGAFEEDGFGSAYVYEGEGTSWTFQQKLTASNQDEGDDFGTSVAISGDTIAVGAPDETSVGFFPNRNQADNSLRNAGAVYQFTKNGEVWEETAFLKSPTGKSVGTAVAVIGNDVIAGAENEFATFTPGTPRTFTELQLTVYTPDLDTPLAGPGFFGFNEPRPIRILNSLFSTTLNSLRLDFTGAGQFNEAECACVVISDPLGNVSDITGATINSASNFTGFDASRLSFDANNVTVNVQGLTFEAGMTLLIDLTFADQPTSAAPQITRYVRSGNRHEIDFTGEAGRSDWRVLGSSDLQGFPIDHTANGTLSETAPGNYRAVLNLPAVAERTHFFRVR